MTMNSNDGPEFDASAVYRIRVRGRLQADWSDRLNGLHIVTVEGSGNTPVTSLTGCLPDQAALSGVLATLNDLRLPLLSVDCLDESAAPESSGSGSPGKGKKRER